MISFRKCDPGEGSLAVLVLALPSLDIDSTNAEPASMFHAQGSQHLFIKNNNKGYQVNNDNNYRHFRLHCSTPNTAAMVWVLIKERKGGKRRTAKEREKEKSWSYINQMFFRLPSSAEDGVLVPVLAISQLPSSLRRRRRSPRSLMASRIFELTSSKSPVVFS